MTKENPQLRQSRKGRLNERNQAAKKATSMNDGGRHRVRGR